MFKFTSWPKNYDQNLKKIAKRKIEVHYLFIKAKTSTTWHKWHSEIHSKFKPWDGHKMVNIESYILVKNLD
jgi:hypothetical protein